MNGYKLLVAHLAGDYVLQTTWMAEEKTKRWAPAAVHGVTYALPFLAVTRSSRALAVIAGTHIVIDHYRLSGHLNWAKNQLAPRRFRYRRGDSDALGGVPGSPPFMAVWLGILVDNTMHMALNGLAARYL